MKKYLFIATGIVGVFSLLLVAAPAAARVNVDVVIGVPSGYEQHPVPAYGYPQPVYVGPRPVYVTPHPVYVQPHPVFIEGRRGHHRGHGHHWEHRKHRNHGYYRY